MLTLKVGEVVQIGPNIRIQLGEKVSGRRCQLAINAPIEIPVRRLGLAKVIDYEGETPNEYANDEVDPT